jgi:hypothetical protein
MTLPVPDRVLVYHETLRQLRTLPWDDAAKLLSQIIRAAVYEGAIKPSTTEKKQIRAHNRILKTEPDEYVPNEWKLKLPDYDTSEGRQYRRDRETLGLEPRKPGPKRQRATGRKSGQKRG